MQPPLSGDDSAPVDASSNSNANTATPSDGRPKSSTHHLPPPTPPLSPAIGGETARFDAATAETTGPLIGAAMRQTVSQGYKFADFRADLLAGCIVGVVALPLSMALAIASGVPPQNGLYTAIIAGVAIAIFGGSRFQVSGPTAAFVVILLPIAAKYGLGGLLVATLMAGLMLVAMGIMRMGQLIRFIPFPVVTGFTTGIAFVIASIQLKDVFGLHLHHDPENAIERLMLVTQALPAFRWADLGIAALTLSILIWFPRLTRKIPSPLVALPVGAAAAYALAHMFPGDATATIATINSRFTYVVDGITHHGIPALPPIPMWPWDAPGPDGAPMTIDAELIRALFMPAVAIAVLGAIESLLSAVIADSITGTQHDPDSELIGQGIGNILVPFFGGIAATGALARTATNIRSGARSPIASIVHAVVVLAAVVAFAPILGYLPMASLGALLLLVAYNMSEWRHFVHVIRVAPRGDIFTLVTCFSLTVVFDMVIAISVGVVLAALLFMRRMAEVSGAKLVRNGHPGLPADVPHDVLVYEIGGPLFFGAAQKAMSSLRVIRAGLRVVILDLHAVPVMDATGLVNLESAIHRLHAAHVQVIVCGVNEQPAQLFAKAGLHDRPGKLTICPTIAEALALATPAPSSAADGVERGAGITSRVSSRRSPVSR